MGLAHRSLSYTGTSCPLGAVIQIVSRWPGLLLIVGPPAVLAGAATVLPDRPLKALAAVAVLGELALIVLLTFLPGGSLC